jgi:hypothetical protein
LEGDDYWTDPYKLQKQVDILEKNADISLVSHDYNIIKNGIACNNNLSHYFNKKQSISVNIENILEPFLIKSCAVMYRREMLPESKIDIITGDIVWFSCLLSKNKAVILKDNMATYRIHSNGIYSQKPEITKHYLDYIDLQTLVNNNFKINDIHNKLELQKEKIQVLINIDIHHQRTSELNNLIFILESGYNLKFKSFSYNLSKALFIHKTKMEIILKYLDFSNLILNINLFFQRPRLKNYFCLLHLAFVLLKNINIIISKKNAKS